MDEFRIFRVYIYYDYMFCRHHEYWILWNMLFTALLQSGRWAFWHLPFGIYAPAHADQEKIITLYVHWSFHYLFIIIYIYDAHTNIFSCKYFYSLLTVRVDCNKQPTLIFVNAVLPEWVTAHQFQRSLCLLQHCNHSVFLSLSLTQFFIANVECSGFWSWEYFFENHPFIWA